MADFNELYDTATRQDAAKDVEMPYLAHYETQPSDPGHPEGGDGEENRAEERISDWAVASSDAADGAVERSQQSDPRAEIERATDQAGPSKSTASGSITAAGSDGGDGTSADLVAEGGRGEVDGVAHGDASADGARDETAPSPTSEEVTPGSLTHTDQAESIQTTANSAAQGAVGGDTTPDSAEAVSAPGSRSAGLTPAELLNRTAFALGGMEPPIVRKMPHKLASQLRSELHRALVQHPAVTETQAKTFCEGLSQAAVVTAFLAAHLDIDLPTDPSTTLATTLFRSRSPLLAGVLERLTRLEQTTNETASNLTRVHQDVRELDQRSEIIEQGIAWAVAERAENLVRGANTVKDVDFNHPSAVAMRDKARAEIKDLRRREARPIR